MPVKPGPFTTDLDPIGRELVAMSSGRTSFRRRLQWIADTVEKRRDLSTADLLTLAIYLRLVATGAVPCEEDGGHYRPNHHAATALRIETALLDRPPAERAPLELLRRVLRHLPSHAAQFRRAEPLTRIRDIAHRNDIPSDLKSEIKHTLQNKLHRSAGPEDLATSQRLLERVTRQPGEYSGDFVEQFRIFHGELEEFFNARSLKDDLALLAETGPEPLRAPTRRLLAVDEGAPREELALGVELRALLMGAYDAAGDAEAQRLRVTEAKLEERAFVLLSALVEGLSGRARTHGSAAPEAVIDELVCVVALGLQHLAVGGHEVARVTEAEALRQLIDHEPAGSDAPWLLRAAYAGLAQDLIGRVSAALLVAAAGRVEALGQALGVGRQQIDFYAEGEVRGHLAYPLSRGVELLEATVDRALGAPPWQVIVPGKATGRWVVADTLEGLELTAPSIVRLRRAVGDEHVPPRVHGVLLEHDLPALSHLAIRARQAGVVMAAARRGDAFDELDAGSRQALADAPEHLELTVGQAGVGLAAGAREAAAAPRGPGAVRPVVVGRTVDAPLLAADAIERDDAGAKAFAARRLGELCRAGELDATAPPCWALPFGTLRRCVAGAGRTDEYDTALAALAAAPESELDAAAARVRAVLESLPLPAPEQAAADAALPAEGLLVVRSSGNLEDLAGHGAAGLHRSVVGVPRAAVGAAVSRVLASLFTNAAVRAFRGATVPVTEVDMAVLLQPLVPAEASFVLYTRSPFDPGGPNAHVELAAGLGEVLASATGVGAPYRLTVDRNTQAHRWLAFSSYGDALIATATTPPEPRVARHAALPFVRDPAARARLARKLARLAAALEAHLGGPQDVEGAIVGETIHLVQSRPAAL